MAVTGESRLFEVMQTLNELELKVKALSDGPEAITKDFVLDALDTVDARNFLLKLMENYKDDAEIPNRDSVKEIVEEYIEENEIPNNDSVVDLIGEQVSSTVVSALEDHDFDTIITNFLDYGDYPSTDCVRDMISEYAPDQSEEFLGEAEDFFRQIIAGLPSCWIQAIARILDRVNNDSEGKSRNKRHNQRNITLKNKTLKILEDEHNFNYQEVLSKVTNDHEEGIKKEANEKDALARKGELEKAKLKVEELEEAMKKSE